MSKLDLSDPLDSGVMSGLLATVAADLEGSVDDETLIRFTAWLAGIDHDAAEEWYEAVTERVANFEMPGGERFNFGTGEVH